MKTGKLKGRTIEPVLAFHGTPAMFLDFDYGKGLPQFTDSERMAWCFGESTKIKSNLLGEVRVLKAHLNIQQPLKTSEFWLRFNGSVEAAKAAGFDGLKDILTEDIRYSPFNQEQIEVLEVLQPEQPKRASGPRM